LSYMFATGTAHAPARERLLRRGAQRGRGRVRCSAAPLLPLLPWASERSPGSGGGGATFVEATPAMGSEAAEDGQAWFRSAAGAALYEPIYRRLWFLLGYPGPDAEHASAEAALADFAGPDRVLLDVSCGPGLFSERFAKSGSFGSLAALDLSAAMCELTSRRIGDRGVVYRADVSALPFVDGAVDAAHAGAALHCWPDPVAGLSEVRRVLKPGAPLVLSTVSLPGAARANMKAKGVSDGGEYASRVREQNMPFWSSSAVLGLLEEAGFERPELLEEDKSFILARAFAPN